MCSRYRDNEIRPTRDHPLRSISKLKFVQLGPDLFDDHVTPGRPAMAAHFRREPFVDRRDEIGKNGDPYNLAAALCTSDQRRSG